MKRKIFLVVMGLVASLAGSAQAGGLDPKESEEFRQARQLYKSGNYQAAADIFSRLGAAHPDMPHFTRNAGAAYYYLKQPDPALSNLREYLRVRKKLTAEDREEVEKWIAEMEQLRAQSPVAPSPASAGGAPMATFPTAQPLRPAPGGAAPGTAPPGYLPPTYYAPATTPAQPPMPGFAGSPPAYPPAGPAAPAVAPGASAPAFPGGAPAAAASVGTLPGATLPAFPGAASGQPYPPAYSSAYPGQAAGTVSPTPEGMVEQPRAADESGSVLPWIIGGAGVATIALGGMFTYLYRSAYADTRTQYDPSRESAGRTYSYLQFVCYGLGAAGVATGAILLLRSDHADTSATVSVAPALGFQMAGAELQVRY